MVKNDAVLRLRILEALDRVEPVNTRESGLADLKKVIVDTLTRENYKALLKLCFTDRNRPFLQHLLPLILDLHSSLGRDVAQSEIEACILFSITDRSNHYTICNVWKQLIEKRFLDPLAVTKYLRGSSRSDRDSRKCLGQMLVIAVEFSMKIKDEQRLGSFLNDMLDLHSTTKYADISAELFESITILIPVLITEISPSCSNLIADALGILARTSKIQLTRSVALACCKFLHAVAENTPDPTSLLHFKPKVLKTLSRDNLPLFAHTRSNPTLRDAITEATLAWRTRIPDITKDTDISWLPESPHLKSESPSAKLFDNIQDSPIPVSEISFNCVEDTFDDDSSESPLRPVPVTPESYVPRQQSPASETSLNCMDDTLEHHSSEFTLKSHPITSEPPIYRDKSSPIPIEDISLTFHELVAQLSSTCSLHRRSRIYDALLALSSREDFADSVRSVDVMALFDHLRTHPDKSPETQLLQYKFFGTKLE